MHNPVRLVGVILMLAGPVIAQAAVTLTAKDLYNGFDAQRVVLDEKAGTLTLDARAIKYKQPGIIVTDPIDLGPSEGIVGLAGKVTDVLVGINGAFPAGSQTTVEVRSGDNDLDQSAWSDWAKTAKGEQVPDADGKTSAFAQNFGGLKGRYVQLRLTLTAKDDKSLPALSSVLFGTKTIVPIPPWSGKLTVVDSQIQKIVRSPIEFVYERPDTPKLAAFRKAAKLDDAVAGAKDDFEKLVKLMDYVCSFKDIRGTGREEKGCYQWDIDTVFEVKDGKPTVYGHCMTYSEVLVTAATALGYVGSRHMAMAGYQDKSHEVCDIWVPSLGKWVYFDPSCDQYYTDKKTKEKLNLIELHNIVAEKLVPEGKDMNWWVERPNAESKQVMASGIGKTVVDCRMGPWHYGDPQDPNYDWGTLHGYVCTGFVQMTPRNDFNSNPSAMSKHFSHEPGYDNYPVWSDAKTPPRNGNWYTRMRDFYWTLDQASIRLVQAGEGVLNVELGQSMPFFKSYQLKVDGAEVKDFNQKSPFAWTLKPGENKLEVAPVNEFGKVGLGSSVVVKYTKG